MKNWNVWINSLQNHLKRSHSLHPLATDQYALLLLFSNLHCFPLTCLPKTIAHPTNHARNNWLPLRPPLPLPYLSYVLDIYDGDPQGLIPNVPTSNMKTCSACNSSTEIFKM